MGRNTRRWHRSKLRTESTTKRHSLVEILEPRRVLMADPIISEFQADNDSTLVDEDGEFSDWIEIQNSDAEALDVGGWYITDDATELTKWEIPSVTIPADGHVVIFASNKDRTDAAGELHTNFRLAAGGEYLALVKPDGITVAQDFGESYPAQEPDQSYGLGIARATILAVDGSSTVKTLVPTDDSLGENWTQVGFDDAAWTSGDLAVGYERLVPGTSESLTFDAPLGPDWTVDVPDGALGSALVINGSLKMTVPETGQDATSADRGLAPIIYRDLVGESPTDWEVMTHMDKQGSGYAGIVVYDAATGKPGVTFEHRSSRNYRLTSGDAEVDVRGPSGRDFFLRLVRDELARTWTGYFKVAVDDEWELAGTLTDGVDGAVTTADPKPGLIARTPTSTADATVFDFDVIVQDQRAVYAPQIGTDVGAAMANNSSIYMRIPFTVDGDPQRFDEMDLTASFDDGIRAYLNGTEVSAQNVPIIGTWDSAASSSQGAVGGRIPVHQIDLAEHIGLLRAGENVLAIHGMNVDKTDSDFFFDADMIASDFQPLSEQTFTQPSPGAANLLPSAPTPQITTADGIFFGSQTITIEVEPVAPTLEIRYTLDGNEPTQASPLYTEPFTITESARLQVRVFDNLPIPKFEPSNLASGTFFALNEELRDRDSNIPIIILDSLGQGLPGSGSTTLVGLNVIAYEVSEVDGRAKIGELVDYVGRGGARDRGSSTAGQAKPNMNFELWGSSGTDQDDDEAVAWLGLDADADWVLHAPFSFDRALIRNQMAFDLSNQMGMWASDTRNVEVYLNRADGVVSESDYMGVYALTEKIDQGANRVDIASTSPDDVAEPEISGGYIWKVDRADPDAAGFTAGRQSLNWVYPKSPNSRTAREDQKATEAQQDWVVDYFNAFSDTLAEPDINDPEGYTKYIDPISFVDHQMHNVFTMNVDALRLSAYLHKDEGGKITYGPVWDFDRSAESNDARDDDPNVWRSEIPDFGTDFFGNGTQRWWGDLFSDPGFWQLYVDRWQMWREDVLSDANIVATIDKLADEVREAAERNFEATVNRGVRPRSTSNYENNQLDGTYEGEVNNLKTWLLERAKFMDSNFASKPTVALDGNAISGAAGYAIDAGAQVGVSAPPIRFFEETVLISGEPGAATGKFFVPTNNDLGDTWFATAFNDDAWQSGPLGVGFDEDDNFTDLIKTTLDPRAIQEGATTIFARIDFDVADLNAILEQDLQLKLKYDDSAIVYLNGTEVFRSAIRDEDLAWDSRGRARATADSAEFEDITLNDFRNLLVQGNNVLAVRNINSSATNSDMFFLPELLNRKTLFGKSPLAQVFYTTDGTDPRGPDGNPSASAIEAAAGSQITINENTRVIARNFDPSDRGKESAIVLTDWSGPVEINFEVDAPILQITEVNYNPVGPTMAEQDALGAAVDGDNFEFIEIRNLEADAISLVGVELSDGVQFDFASSDMTSLEAGGYALVVANKAAFEARYGVGLPVAGEFTGNLNNNGEDIDLIGSTGAVLFSVNYNDNDPWSVTADGLGATLELADSNTVTTATQSKYYAWRGSTEMGGTPGAASQGAVGVVINEIVASSDGVNLTDSIELFNTTGQAIDISGWNLSDAAGDFAKFTIPAGTMLAAGGYVAFDESDFNPADGTGFALSGDRGDDVYLTIPGAGGLLFVDDVHFRETETDRSLARIPNGTGRLAPAAAPTLGAANGAHLVGSIAISEINFNPGAPSPAALAVAPNLTDNDLEFVELANRTGDAIDLENWEVRGGVDFDFAAGTTLAASERIVIVKFNPENPENANQLLGFKTQYGIGDGVRIFGGYSGQLNNSDDQVLLLRPIAPPADRPNFVPHVQEDEVLYDGLAPWPTSADGGGNSLQRSDLASLGNDATAWVAAIPTPGSEAGTANADFDANGMVNAADIDLLNAEIRGGGGNTSFDLTNDGLVDSADRDAMVHVVLGTTYGDANVNRVFDSRDLVLIFQAGEYEDDTAGNSTWAEGDWDGDGDFTSSDLVKAFQDSGYVFAAVAVPDLSLIGAALADIDGQPTDASAEDGEMVAEVSSVARTGSDLKMNDVHDSIFAEMETGREDDESESDIEELA